MWVGKEGTAPTSLSPRRSFSYGVDLRVVNEKTKLNNSYSTILYIVRGRGERRKEDLRKVNTNVYELKSVGFSLFVL